MVTTRPPKTIVKPTALGPVANTDTKLLIYGLFQKGRVLAQDEILLGSLAACITITLRLYANHKGIELTGADDCSDCDERADGFIERIQSHVTLRGSFDDAQRKRLAQVAQRCPVHKTLANGVHISDAVSFDSP